MGDETTVDELFLKIWPDGVPPRERVVFSLIPADQKSEVLKRLDAVWRAEKGEPWKELADGIGLKRSAFFNLRKQWRSNLIEGVIPRETRPGRGLSVGEDDALRRAARKLLEGDNGGARNVELARLLVEEPPSRDSFYLSQLQKAERVIQHERRSLARRPDYLRKAYGRGMLLDLTAVNIVLATEPMTIAVVAALIETGSGLIMGSAIGRIEEGLDLERRAVEGSVEFLRSRRADVAKSGRLECELSLVLPANCDLVADQKAVLEEAAGDVHLGAVGAYGFGMGIVQIFGPRIGKLVVKPRRTLSSEISEFSGRRVDYRHEHESSLDMTKPIPRSVSEAAAIWEREVERHNKDIILALSDAGLINGDGLREGRMAEVLFALGKVLEGIKPGETGA